MRIIKDKEFEREVFEYLKKQFDKVIWLSEHTNSSIDFKCYKSEIEYFIEAKDSIIGKIFLSPNQKNIDAVAIKEKNNIKLIWKKDFNGQIKYSHTTIIKINENIKLELDEIKEFKRETYNDIIEKLLINYKLLNKSSKNKKKN